MFYYPGASTSTCSICSPIDDVASAGPGSIDFMEVWTGCCFTPQGTVYLRAGKVVLFVVVSYGFLWKLVGKVYPLSIARWFSWTPGFQRRPIYSIFIPGHSKIPAALLFSCPLFICRLSCPVFLFSSLFCASLLRFSIYFFWSENENSKPFSDPFPKVLGPMNFVCFFRFSLRLCACDSFRHTGEGLAVLNWWPWWQDINSLAESILCWPRNPWATAALSHGLVQTELAFRLQLAWQTLVFGIAMPIAWGLRSRCLPRNMQAWLTHIDIRADLVVLNWWQWRQDINSLAESILLT